MCMRAVRTAVSLKGRSRDFPLGICRKLDVNSTKASAKYYSAVAAAAATAPAVPPPARGAIDTAATTKYRYRKRTSSINDNLTNIISSSGDNNNKLPTVYEAIAAASHQKQVLFLDDKVHQWFWHNVPVSKSYAHYQFLIQHNVSLSNSPYCKKMFRRLLTGSEVEFRLATFQVFLEDQDHVPIFKEKFHTLHDFDSMLHIFNGIVKTKNFQNIKYFLLALTEKMALLTPKQVNETTIQQIELMYVKFNNSLLYYLLLSGNTEVFIKTYKNVQLYIKNSSLPRHTDDPEVSMALMKAVHLYMTLLKESNMPDLTFQLLRTLQTVKQKGSKKFRRFLASTVTSTLRSFNDPRLTANFVLATHQTTSTAKTFNELGLWNYIFHEKPGKLDQTQLKLEVDAIALKKSSDSLRSVGVLNKAMLTEVYRSFLSISANTMSSPDYEKCIRSLYEHYVQYCTNNKHLLSVTKHDTGILNTILYHTRYSLQNTQLAYNFLTHFYSQEFSKHIKNTVKKCPFSIIINNNDFLTSDKLENLFSLMSKNGYPLTFHICYTMLKRSLNSKNDVEAHSWYERIIDGGFRFDNRGLMEIVLLKNWDFPRYFDKKLLLKLQAEDEGTDLNQIVDDNNDNSSELLNSFSDIVADIKANMHI